MSLAAAVLSLYPEGAPPPPAPGIAKPSDEEFKIPLQTMASLAGSVESWLKGENMRTKHILTLVVLVVVVSVALSLVPW